MEKKFYLFDGEPGWTGFKIVEFSESQYDAMIEEVRRFHEMYERHPTVFYGERLQFEPAEIVKSWKIKSEAK